ncbi:flagellar biosynthesis anti-sigma factor FlgM [Lachnospiraceae bacterium JLR.KK008]
MRIEAYTQVQQIYQTKKAVKAGNTAKSNASDQLQISGIGKDIQTAKQAITNASDIREDMTAPLKSSIQSGNYQVSEESFAAKLLEKYNEMR